MAIYTNTLSLIGNTPVVQIKSFDTGLCSLFLKLESQNPGGSIKDRIALTMIEAAERKGLLNPGGTIVEATAGNTGIGLALVAKLKSYNLILVIPDKMSREKINHLKALGAEIVLTRSDVGKGHPEYYQDLAEKIAKERNAYYVNQFNNESNPLAHEIGTGPEIWSQMNHDVDAIILGVGSSGTMTGLTRFFSKVSPKIQLILADPVGSILADYINKGILLEESGSWVVEGIGEDFIPPIADFSMCKKAYSISDSESLEMARLLLKKEGILGGSSTGTLLATALKYCQEQTSPKRVLTFVCDNGNKYLSKQFNEFWMVDEGFTKRTSMGDLRDLISHRAWEGESINLREDDTLSTAYKRMKLYDVSQLPVLENNKIIGIVDENDLLLAVSIHKDGFSKKVSEIMITKLIKISERENFEVVLDILKQGFVAIVETKGQFMGLITQIDALNYLRKRISE
jgi:cystathionine beta-synthase